MSETELLRGQILGLERRISELEKLMGEKGEILYKDGRQIVHLQEKITKLEKKLSAVNHTKNQMIECRIMADNDQDEQIAELRESWAQQQENIDYNMKFLTNHTNKIRDACVKDYNELKKDSGGDSTDDSKTYHPDQTTSKPPEPNMADDVGNPLIGRISGSAEPRENDDLRMIEVEGNMYWMPKMDMYHNIIVKREDLQWLFKELENWIHEYMDGLPKALKKHLEPVEKLKEEYNL